MTSNPESELREPHERCITQKKGQNQRLQGLTPGCSAHRNSHSHEQRFQACCSLCRLNLQWHSHLEREKIATYAEFEPPRSFKGHFLSGCFTWFPGRSSKPTVALSLVNWRYLLEHAGCLGTWTATYNLLVKHPITRLASSFASKQNAWSSGLC